MSFMMHVVLVSMPTWAYVDQYSAQFLQVITDCSDALDLYFMRKMIEQALEAADVEHYVASFSNETIVYKGWLRSDQIRQFYMDFGSVHSRFSTNTFPSWARAHPNRLLMHNGEINTIKGNSNWMKARTKQWLVDTFGEKGKRVEAIIDESGSDSAIVDNVMEFLSLSMPPEQAAMIMIPEPWKYQDYDNPVIKDFYEFYSYLMEPWDGPTMISFCDNHKLGALTDRNGLRPGRYYVTKSNEIIYSSEVGVVDVEEDHTANGYEGRHREIHETFDFAGEGPYRGDGLRPAARLPVESFKTAVRLFQAAFCTGHQSAARFPMKR